MVDLSSDTPQPHPAVAWVIAAVVLLSVAVNPIEFKTSADFDRATASVNVITLAKLAIAGIAAGISGLAILFSPRTRRLLLSVPGVGLLGLGGVFIGTSVFASELTRGISQASAILFVVFVLFTATSLAMLGPRKMVAAMIAGTTAYLILTWGIFLVLPEQGRFIEYTSETESVLRMGGTGHPNNIAKTAITIALVSIAMWVGPTRMGQPDDVVAIGVRGDGRWGVWPRVLLMGVIGLAAATVIATFSRTAVLAGVAAGVVMLFDRLVRRGGLTLMVCGGGAAAVLLLAASLISGDGPLSQSAVNVVTKSGDVEELTSLTGRTAIWREAIGWISQRPWTGWGMDSAASVMSRRATGTHNLLLHVCFSGGVFAGVLFLGLAAWSLVAAVTSHHAWIRGVLTYVLVSGLVEDTIFESFATSLTMLWMMALLAPALIAGDGRPQRG